MNSQLRIALNCLFFIQLSLMGLAQPGVITTVAGKNSAGFSGDGELAASAQLNAPSGSAVDTAGNLFIADTQNHRIRKVTPDGIISTVAGGGYYPNNGLDGQIGDGGLATSAHLSYPTSVAIDNAGNLYIADTGENCIRKVVPNGIISTVAGIAYVDPNGEGAYGGDNGPATSAWLYVPESVAIDTSGNLYIADSGNHKVRKVTPDGIIRRIAGGVWSYNPNQFYVGDGGPATSAWMFWPTSVAVDISGNLFIADNHRIRKVAPDGFITTVAGTGTSGFSGDGELATSALLNPNGIAVDIAGNLFITDTDHNRIRRVTPRGIITTVAGNGESGFFGDSGPAIHAELNDPCGITLDSNGNLFFADTGNNRIRKVTALPADTYFPQVAIGGGWSTTFTLINTGPNIVSGNLILSDNQGNPLNVSTSILGTGSSFPISMPAGGTMFLFANPISPGDTAKSGWAAVETYGGLLDGVATYQSSHQAVLQNAAGVLSSQPTQFATIPIDENDSQNIKTAYAIANPTDQVLTIKFALVDTNGIVVDDSVSVTLNPGQQFAKYFNQDFSNRPIFQGSIVLRTQGEGAFVAVALSQNQHIFTAIPIIPSVATNISN
jgi:sugar lactone lactonase YvrE